MSIRVGDKVDVTDGPYSFCHEARFKKEKLVGTVKAVRTDQKWNYIVYDVAVDMRSSSTYNELGVVEWPFVEDKVHLIKRPVPVEFWSES